jgi:Uma2 family endonuclease
LVITRGHGQGERPKHRCAKDHSQVPPTPRTLVIITTTHAIRVLLVEVSDKTLRTDLGRKARIYASAGVPEYRAVDLNAHTVYVHRTPLDGAYRTRTVMVRGVEVSAQFASAVCFTIDEILG